MTDRYGAARGPGGLWPLFTGLAAVAIVVVVGGLIVGGAFGPGTADSSASPIAASASAPERESAAGSAAPVPSTTPSQTAASTPPPPSTTLLFRVGAPDTIQYVLGLADGPAGRVAVLNVLGSATVPPTGWTGDGAVYIEADDGSWSAVDTGPTFEEMRISAFLHPPEGPLVIYGGNPYAPSPREGIRVWTSPDGRSWSEATATTGLTIAEGPLGYVQAAVLPADGDVHTLEIHTSDDALSWNLVHTMDVPRGSVVRAVGVGPEGYVVTYDEAREERRSRILASADGSSWHQAPEQASLAPDDIVMVIADLGPDWVGAGWFGIDASAIALWSSTDGLTWERTGALTSSTASDAYPAHLFESNGRLFLNASIAAEGSDTRPAGVWTSLDGRTWEPIDLGPEAEVRAALPADCGFLLGGRIGIDSGEAAIWCWDPEA